MLAGGIRPHLYCLPILKHGSHQHKLIEAATSGNPKFFLGTDSAPHARSQKESCCGCAGSYTSFHALPLYAEAFDKAGKLDKLEAFASFFGPDFYGLKRNTGSVTLNRESWTVPESFEYLGESLRPLCAGETLNWKVSDS
jgi:dihydroorotase